MNIEERLRVLTGKILPNGYDFFPQQKQAILAEGSIDIVAGPGSGKTTVLIAKCGLLLENNILTNKGICLITHTNVAVDEIRAGLFKLGKGDVDYPNFIGTIQEFFNHFFARKAFHFLLGEKKFRVLDDEEYQEKFESVFRYNKPDWPADYNIPVFSKRNPQLEIHEDSSFFITSEAPQSYRASFNNSIERMFEWGLVNNKQCLELSRWYINKYKSQIKRALSKRFNYVLLDEAQDTSALQYELLETLLEDNDIHYQKFGDPYQALYNIFEGNEDAWKPTESGANYQEIAETSRFGSSVAEVVKNVCIEKYDSFISLNIVDSFEPMYFTYRDEEDLTTTYRELIDHLEAQSESYASSNKKDAILSAFHNDLTALFSIYKKPTTKPRNHQSPLNRIVNFSLDLLSRESTISLIDINEFKESNIKFKMIISQIVKEFIQQEADMSKILELFRKSLELVSNREKNSFEKIDIEGQISYFREMFISEKRVVLNETNDRDLYIGTIHSAKGETHRSTLLVLDSIFSMFNSNIDYSMFDLLLNYLVGNYVNPAEILDSRERNETIKALKLAYVALSRPTHLMAIAIPEQLLDGFERLQLLDENGWKNVKDLLSINNETQA